MRTVTVDTDNEYPVSEYFYTNTTGSKAVRNTANFLERNTYTGLRKFPEERTHNEIEALHKVFTGIQMANEDIKRKRALYFAQLRVRIGVGFHGMELYRLIKKIRKLKFLPYPTMDNWFLSYNQLDAIMKFNNEPCYRKCVSHVAQQAIKKTVESWKAYFKQLKDWKANPGKYKGKPGIPKYIREPETTAHFTNQVAKSVYTGKRFALQLANYGTIDICPKKLIKGKFVKLEVKPRYGGYRLLITYEDDLKEPVLPETPKRIAALDPGMENFAAVATNTGLTPFIIDGNWLKSINQWFNKERARLLSAVTSGSDSTHSKKRSKRLDSLSRDRDNVLDDFFYKTGHYIFRKLKADHIEVLVIGHNDDQKQEINMGHVTNQGFVSIPFARFTQIMQFLSWEYGIPVIVREESYTSKASCLDLDYIPTWSADDDTKYTFSGKRVMRGLYRAKDGRVLNADVNGAANILRKEYPEAFKDVDMSYLCNTTLKISAYEILKIKKVENHKSKNYLQNKKSPGASVNHRLREKRQYELDEAFKAKRKPRWEKPKNQDQAKAA